MRLNSRGASYLRDDNDNEPIGGGNYQRTLAASYSYNTYCFLLVG